jgi:YesN/AraC family two-component response regulator
MKEIVPEFISNNSEFELLDKENQLGITNYELGITNRKSFSEGKQLGTEGRFPEGSNYEPEVAFQRETITDTDNDNANDNVNDKVNRKANDSDLLLFKQLNRLVVEQQIHLNPDATLDSVASLLEVNRKYLSYAINRCTGDNFNAYINKFRVKEVIRIMMDKKISKNLSIDGIASKAGFNDRTTMYRAFKKSTGYSPTYYRESLQEVEDQ